MIVMREQYPPFFLRRAMQVQRFLFHLVQRIEVLA